MTKTKKERNYTSYSFHKITLREPIQTQQPKEYLKWFNDLQSDDGQMLPILTNLQSHSSHIDILKDNSTYDYSYTYNILSLLSISGD